MSPTTTPVPARALNAQDYRTLGLSALGGALEFYDFIIFVFFATVIGHLFFPPDMPDWLVMIQTFGIFAAGYLVRPIGGIILAHYGDRYGRKRVFAFSILLMALSTLGMALMPTYATSALQPRSCSSCFACSRVRRSAARFPAPGPSCLNTFPSAMSALPVVC